MEGIQARLSARLGPLPVWAWAALALVLIVGFMWWKKIGFFAPSDQPSATGSDQAVGSPDLPAGLGGLGGAGSLATPTDPNPYVAVPSAGYGSNYSSVDPGNSSVVSQPSTDLSGTGSGNLFQQAAAAAQAFAARYTAPTPAQNAYAVGVAQSLIPSGSTTFSTPRTGAF